MNKPVTAGQRVLRKCQEHWPPISKSRLARRLDLDAAALSRILKGDRRAPDGFYEQIALILGCAVADLLSSEEAA